MADNVNEIENIEEVKPFRFRTSDGTEYTLEFDREAVKYGENTGFKVENFDDKIIVNTERIFYIAFRMHHPDVTKKESDRILYEELCGVTSDELKQLISLYMLPYTALIYEEGTEKNGRRVTVL